MGKRFDEVAPELNRAGELSAGRMNELAIVSNRDENLPTIRSSDEFGNRIEEVVFHPSYHELGALVWRTGALSLLGERGNQLLAGSLAFLMAHNGEAGHLCPVACTAGAIKLIQQTGTAGQKTKYLPRLLDPNYKGRIHASQFLTEVQGGSDVGANACEAIPAADRPGWFRITGEKWFCSVMDASLFVVTARPQGAADGTKGLALFLVPRVIDGAVNRFRILRLKTKLGTRSMATGETEFQGALAEPVGPLEDGFKNVVRIVLDTSRMYNAVAACGMMQRAYVEANSYAHHRLAFGRPISDYPLVKATLARMSVRANASLAATLRILHHTDLTEQNPDPQRTNARRIDVMLNKYWTSTACTEVVRSGIEILGGNGTIEDFSVLPRLYRDAMVIESWEGTHNTLCLQILRDFAQRGMHAAWLQQIRADIESIHQPLLAEHRQRASDLAEKVSAEIAEVVSSPEEISTLRIRPLVDRMCTLAGYVSLLLIENGAENPELRLLNFYSASL